MKFPSGLDQFEQGRHVGCSFVSQGEGRSWGIG